MVLWHQLLAFLVCFAYASFFEWIAHRHFMHVRRFPLKFVFQGHAHIHHRLYRGDHSFEAQGPVRLADVTLRWFSFPLIFLGHLPALLAVEHLTGATVLAGSLAALILYYAGFEYTHFLMHVPSGHAIERCGWFRFLCNHHRLHHKFIRCNYNVFIPLADACLGTLARTDQWRPRKRKKRGPPLPEAGLLRRVTAVCRSLPRLSEHKK